MRYLTIFFIIISALPVLAQRPHRYMGYHSPYYNNFYAQERQFREPYYSTNYPGDYNYQRSSMLSAIKQYFSGQLTGFTPQIAPDVLPSMRPSDFGRQRNETYVSPWGSGYRVNNYGAGSSSGIQILD